MSKYSDWGKLKISPNIPNLSWINDQFVYPKTPIYKKQYQHFKKHADILNINVQTYLSVGTGLGRHIVIAKEIFPTINHIIGIDNEIKPHHTISQLDVTFVHIKKDLISAFKQIQDQGLKFDFIVFENLGHDHNIISTQAIELLLSLQNKNSLLALIGDTKFDTSLLLSTDGYMRIPNETESWGDTTEHNFWLYR